MKVYPKVPDPWAEFRWIRLKVKDGRMKEIYKIKKSTPLRKLMEHYCMPFGLRLQSVRFFTADGKRILPDDTAWKLGLESGDRINFYISC